MSARFKESKATTAKNAQLLRAMLKRPENKLCVDCKRNDPRWASTNLGCFLCIRCSGIHRGLGVHISRVRSVDLDTWTPEQIANMDRWGNYKANLYWEAHLKPGHQPPEHKMEQFIRSKYESKRWAMEGPLPDPATLGEPGDDASVTSSATAPAAAATTSPTSPPATSTRRQQQPTAIDLLGGAFGSDAPSASSAAANRASKAPASLGQPTPPSSRSSPLPSAVPQQPQRSAVPAATAKPSSGNNNGLFDLDFSASSASPSSGGNLSSNASARKNNAGILSLFGSGPAPSTATSPSVQAPSVSSGLDAFASLNLGGPSSSTSASSYHQHAPSTTSNWTTTSSSSQLWGLTPTATSAAPAGGRPASNSISAGNPWAAAPAPATTASTTTMPSAAPASSTNDFLSLSSGTIPSSSAAPPSYSSSSSSYSHQSTAASTLNNYSSPPPPAAAASSSGHSSMDFFNSQDIWGDSGHSASNGFSADGGAAHSSSHKPFGGNDAGGFGGFSSASSGGKAGGFDDLWS